MVATRLSAAIKVLTCKSAHVSYQRRLGDDVHTIGFGYGDIRDVVLMARSLKFASEEFMSSITAAATEVGELHILEELKEAIDKTLETDNGRE